MWAHLTPFVPVLLVVASACAVVVTGRLRQNDDVVPLRALVAIGLGGALVASVALFAVPRAESPDALVVDDYTLCFNILVCAFGLLTLAAPGDAGHRGPVGSGGVAALMLLTVAGMMLVPAARDLVVLGLTLQVVWIGAVALIGAGQHGEASTEAGLKTLILGAVAGALLFYGIAILYAMTGATRLDLLAERIAASSLDPNVLVLFALVLLLAGFAFALSVVPCHAWASDVSRGADAPLAGFVTAGVKAVGAAACLRVLLAGFEALRIDWLPVVSALAGVTMVVGAVAAVAQPSARRMLAAVGIAQSGYLLVGLVTASRAGKASVLFSLLTWGTAHVAIFMSLPAVSRPGHPHDDVRDFAGLGRQRPGLAALLTICLVSLAGLPPLGGFAARWFVLVAALQEGLAALVVLGAVAGVALTFACLRLVVQMYMTDPHAGPAGRPPTPRRTLAGLAAAAAVLIHAGVWPGWWLDVALQSVASVF